MNLKGHPATLVHSGDANRKHGAYAEARVLTPRGRALVGEILAMPHVCGLDRVAAEELAALVEIVAAIDGELARTGVVGRGSRDRSGILKVRATFSRRIEEWADRLGMTPRSRAELVRDLAGGSLASELACQRSRADLAV